MVTVTIVCLAARASAQDAPKAGIAMGYPASIGVVWHVSDGVALRPEIGVSRSSGEFTATSFISIGGTTNTTTSLTTNDNWQVAIGLSALFYLSRHDALRTYVSPRWAYTRTSSSSASGPSPNQSSSSTGNGNFVSGSFGAEYALARRFSVFGELGLGYNRTITSPTSGSSGVTTTDSASRTFSTRSGAGVILYF
jgi:hypothetical protein